MSYTKVEENETALCLLKISGATDEVMLPENIFPHLFTTLAWDNIDQIEELLQEKVQLTELMASLFSQRRLDQSQTNHCAQLFRKTRREV